MNKLILFLFTLLTITTAERSFYGPHPIKEHTYSYEQNYENETVSKTFSMIILLLPLSILLLCVCFLFYYLISI